MLVFSLMSLYIKHNIQHLFPPSSCHISSVFLLTSPFHLCLFLHLFIHYISSVLAASPVDLCSLGEDCTELHISEDILKLRHLALATNMPLFLGVGEIEVDIALESYWRSREIHFIKLLSVSVCFFFCPCRTNTHIHTL